VRQQTITYGAEICTTGWNKITAQIKRILHIVLFKTCESNLFNAIRLSYLVFTSCLLFNYSKRYCITNMWFENVTAICRPPMVICSYPNKKNEHRTTFIITREKKISRLAKEQCSSFPNIPNYDRRAYLPRLLHHHHSTLSFLTRSLLFLIASDRESRTVVRVRIFLLRLVDDKITPNQQ